MSVPYTLDVQRKSKSEVGSLFLGFPSKRTQINWSLIYYSRVAKSQSGKDFQVQLFPFDLWDLKIGEGDEQEETRERRTRRKDIITCDKKNKSLVQLTLMERQKVITPFPSIFVSASLWQIVMMTERGTHSMCYIIYYSARTIYGCVFPKCRLQMALK